LFYSICLDFPVSMGDYQAPATPDDPCLLHLSCHIPTERALPPREQRRLARMFLYTTPFETFEQKLRAQLQAALGPGGFDARRDIKAITLNRWPHGYADSLSGLDDPQWAPGQRPNEIGRQRFGRVAIANTDSGIGGTGGAIHEGLRAVRELGA
jgi:spermidine dehydrogenase